MSLSAAVAASILLVRGLRGRLPPLAWIGPAAIAFLFLVPRGYGYFCVKLTVAYVILLHCLNRARHWLRDRLDV
jgi:hypothetical protein